MIGLLLCGLAQQATLLAEPEAVRTGEPVTWTLLVEHDVDERVVVADDAVPPDDTWVLLEGPERVRVRDGEVAFTRLEWRLFSLEPGTRQLPPLAITLSSGLELEALAGAVEVAGARSPRVEVGQRWRGMVTTTIASPGLSSRVQAMRRPFGSMA